MAPASTIVEREKEPSRLNRRALLGSAGTLAVSGAVLATPAAALAGRNPAGGACAVPTPAGFRKFLVYMAEGNAGSITDPAFVLAFQRDVYARDEAAVRAYARQAMQFFLDRFGLDFTGATAPTAVGPWEIEGAVMQGSVFSPANGYTAYVVSEEAVGPRGWVVRDSSFNVRLTADQTLHGTWGGTGGKPAREGSVVVFGDYNIKVDKPGASERGETIQIHSNRARRSSATSTANSTSSATCPTRSGAPDTPAAWGRRTAASATCSPFRPRSRSTREVRQRRGRRSRRPLQLAPMTGTSADAVAARSAPRLRLRQNVTIW